MCKKWLEKVANSSQTEYKITREEKKMTNKEVENVMRKATLERLSREARGEKIRTDCFKCGWKYVDEIKLECPNCKYNFLEGRIVK